MSFSSNTDHTFVENSFTVSGTTSGTAIEWEESVNNGLTVFYGEKSFEFKFPIPIIGEQIIKYKTNISDTYLTENNNKEKLIYKNEVKAYIGDIKVGEANKTVEIDWISKSKPVVVDNGRKLKWTININNIDSFLNNKSGLRIVDIIGDFHDFVADENFPVEVSINGEQSTVVQQGDSSGHYLYDTKTLVYNLGTITVGQNVKNVKLSYFTEINNPTANSNATTNFTNTAKLLWGELNDGPSSGNSIGIGMGIVDKVSTGIGTVKGNTDMEINWTIHLNRNKVEMTDVKFNDTIPKGLEYKENSFKVNGNEVTINPLVDNTIEYTIGGTTTSAITITYTTLVNKNFIGLFTNKDVSFKNQVTLSGTGIDGTQRDEETRILTSNVISKSVATGYNYNTRITSWEIIVNKNKIPLNDVKVIDTIPLGMKFLEDTFEVNGNPVSDGLMPDVKSDDNITESDSFEYTLGNISDTYTITFDTLVKESWLSKAENLNKKLNFTNYATVKANGRNDVNAIAKDEVDNYIIQKYGERAGLDFVKWSVPINPNKINLEIPVTLLDTLQEGLDLDEDSVKLYEMEINDEGEISKGNEIDIKDLTNGYTKNYNKDNREFRFNFAAGTLDEKAYILEFITDANKSININNTIYFEGNTSLPNSNTKELYVDISNWSGGGSSSKGSLKIIKVDENGNPLEGAKYKVYDKLNNIYTKDNSSTGNESLYKNLPYRLYTIEEIETPEGYLKSKELHKVKVQDSDVKVYTFKNVEALTKIKFIKTNDFDKPISGAKFILYDDKDVPIGEPVTSNNKGEVEFSAKVGVGIYYIKEIEAPNGYITLTEPIKVVVSIINDGTEMGIKFADNEINNEFTLVNELVTDKVMVLKVDNSKPGKYLEDSLFGIYTVGSEGPFKQASSDINGTVVFENINKGDYVIREIIPTEGYLKSLSTIYVKVGEDTNNPKNLTILYSKDGIDYSSEPPEFVNEPIEISFNKLDKLDRPLSGAEFTLYDLQDNKLEVATSDEDGNVVFSVVPVGDYIIKESKSPSGYYRYEKDISVKVSVSEDNVAMIEFKVDGEDVEGGFKVINERIPSRPTPLSGKIVVKKINEDKKVLSGAEFTLYDAQGKVVERGTTGSDGTLTFEDLKPGEYVLKETKAPEGYVLEVNESEVTVIANRTETLTFTNEKEEPKKPGRIEIIKTDEDGKLLSDAWFSLVDEKGVTLQNVGTIDGKGAFENVPLGRYTVKEVQAPEGYELLDKAVSVTVESDETITLRFVNMLEGEVIVPVKGSITVNKVDGKNMALSGAEFTLYNENNEIVETAVSDKSGKVIFTNLKDGKYFVKETKAPEGYEILSDTLTIDIVGGNSQTYRFRNVTSEELIEDPDIPLGWEEIDDPEIPTDIVELPDTGSLLNTWMLAMIGILLIIIGIFLNRRKTFE